MGSKKPAKLTKAEKERLKKEAAELKAQQEEEARLQAEQEEQERLEREEKEREERRLFEEQERLRHQAEVDELNLKLEENLAFLNESKRKRIEEKRWQKYLQCDGLPDVSCKRETNTFITLLTEDKNTDIDYILHNCEQLLLLANECDQTMCDLKVEEQDEECVQQVKKTQEDLYNLVTTRLDASISEVLRRPDMCIDTDSQNIVMVKQSENFKICLWGNTAKNPRVKQIEFENDAFTMELPKQMALAEIALQVTYMSYDTLSPQCLQTKPKPLPVVPVLVEITVDYDGDDNKTKDETPIEEMFDATPAPSKLEVSTLNVTKNKKRFSKSKKSKLNVNKSKLDNKSKKNITTEDNKNKKNADNNKLAPDEKLSINPSSKSVAPDDTVLEDEVEVVQEIVEEGVVGLNQYRPYTRLVRVDLVELPPQAKQVNGWIMQQVVEGGLNRLDLEKESGDEEESSSHLTLSAPLTLTFGISDQIIVCDPVQVARWCQKSLTWRTDGLSNVSFQETEDGRHVQFQTDKLGTFCIMQDLYTNMPYVNWCLYPTGHNNCVLKISGGGQLKIKIYVKEDLCSVSFSQEMPRLSYLVGKWKTLDALIESLRSAGINFFPLEDGHRYVPITKKEEIILSPVYVQLGLAAGVFSFQASRWNPECGGAENLVVQAIESLECVQPKRSEYGLYLIKPRITCRLEIKERSHEFSPDVYPDSPLHPNIYHMLRDGCSDVARTRLDSSSVLFTDCVTRLLKATNVFVYS